MKTQKEIPYNELQVLAGQLTIDDMLGSCDDGTYGAPVEVYAVDVDISGMGVKS